MSPHMFVLSAMRQYVNRALLITDYKTYKEPILSYLHILYGSTSYIKVYAISFLRKKVLDGKDNIYFLFATYDVLIAYEIYFRKFFKFLLNSQSGLHSNGRLNKLLMNEASNFSNSIRDTSSGKRQVPQETNRLERIFVTNPGVCWIILFITNSDHIALAQKWSTEVQTTLWKTFWYKNCLLRKNFCQARFQFLDKFAAQHFVWKQKATKKTNRA